MMNNIKKNFNKDIQNSLKIKKDLIKKIHIINKMIKIIVEHLNKSGKILICGNGGSAADAQHLAAELMVRFRQKVKRKPYPAISLVQDTSTITACSNDINFNYLFSRNLEALGSKNDILIVISTSGNSKNIVNVLKKAKKMKIFSIGFLGKNGGESKKFCDLPIIVNSNNTARIQEAHIFLGHFIIENVENKLMSL